MNFSRSLVALPVLLLSQAALSQQVPARVNELANQGLALIEQGRWGEAAAPLKQAVDTAPQDARLRLLLGRAYLESNEPQPALEHLNRAIALAPNDPETTFYLGMAQFETGQTVEAFDTFSRLGTTDPNEAGTQAWLARSALRLARWEEARSALERLRRLTPSAGLLHAQLVEWCFAEEAGELTEDQIRFALERQLGASQKARLRYLWAIVRQRAGDRNQALEQANQALELDRAYEEYYALVVKLQGLAGIEQVDAATLQSGLARFPDSRELLEVAALRHMNSGDLSQAFLIAGRLEDAYPQAVETHILRGRLELARLSFEAASDAFEKAVRIEASDAAAHHYLGIALRRLGNDKAALESFEMAHRLDSANAETLLELGRLHGDWGDLDRALEHLQAAIKLRPEFAAAHNLIAQTLRAMGRLEEANAHGVKFRELSERENP